MIDATVYEVLQFAISMEEEGEKYYRKYADKFAGEPGKVFLKLAGDEVEHARVFKKLYAELEDKADNNYLFDEEVVHYFQGASKSITFNRDQPDIQTVSDVIKEGIRTERKTIEYYESLLKYSKDATTKEMLDRMIKEEKSHAELLEKML